MNLDAEIVELDETERNPIFDESEENEITIPVTLDYVMKAGRARIQKVLSNGDGVPLVPAFMKTKSLA